MKRTPMAFAISLALLPSLAAAQMLEEVIVTAQKKEETLTSAPVAVAIVSGQQLDDFSIFQADELNKLVTGMEVRYEGDSNVGVGLRGVGTFQQQSNPSRVGVYMDDYYMAAVAAFGLASMFDMASVQVLKGPQGTLYGQPSPTGAMILTTQDPNFDGINGHIKGSYTDPNGYNLQGAVNVPIGDTFAVRLAGLTDDRETGTENIVRGLDESRNRDGVRVKALWEPTETFQAKLGYTYMESENSESYRVLETVDTALANYDIGADDRFAIADNRDEIIKKEETFVTLHLSWMIGDVEVKWFSGALDSEVTIESDNDNTDLPDLVLKQNTKYGDFDADQHELRISSTAFDIWDWTVGAYVGDSVSQTNVDIFSAVPGQGVFNIILDIPIESTTKAIFTHNTIALGEDTELTVGLRYNEFANESGNTISGDFLFGSAALPGGGFTDPVVVLPNVFPCIDGSVAPCFAGSDNKQEEWTGTIKLSHYFSDELNLYGTIDRGYRPGANNFDTSGVFQPEFASFDGESVDSFELGLKGDLFDGRARYTAALFYSVYEDYQVPVNFEAYNTVTGEVEIITNAPFANVDEAVQQGIEADFRMMVTDSWMVYAGMTYTNVEFTAGLSPCTDPSQAPVGPNNRFNTCDADGEIASAQPQWSGVVQSEYSWPEAVLGSELYISGLLAYKGKTEVPGDTVGRLDGDSFATLDVFTGLRNDTWSAQLFAKNITDDDGVLSKRPVGQAYNEMTVTPPRTIGITASYNF